MWKTTVGGDSFINLQIKTDEWTGTKSSQSTDHWDKLPKYYIQKHATSYKHLHMQRCEVMYDIHLYIKINKNETPLSPYISRQCCLLGDDGWSILLGRDVWQSGPQTVPPHLHVHKWLLRLPVIFCPGIWLIPPLPSHRRLWVSLRCGGHSGADENGKSSFKLTVKGQVTWYTTLSLATEWSQQ